MLQFVTYVYTSALIVLSHNDREVVTLVVKDGSKSGQNRRKIKDSTGVVIIYGWGGPVQIRKSRALKICPPSTTAHSKFAPPRKPCTEISPPPLRCVNHVYIFQGMMLVSGHFNHESYIGKSWKCKVGMKHEGSILKYIRRASGGENF